MIGIYVLLPVPHCFNLLIILGRDSHNYKISLAVRLHFISKWTLEWFGQLGKNFLCDSDWNCVKFIGKHWGNWNLYRIASSHLEVQSVRQQFTWFSHVGPCTFHKCILGCFELFAGKVNGIVFQLFSNCLPLVYIKKLIFMCLCSNWSVHWTESLSSWFLQVDHHSAFIASFVSFFPAFLLFNLFSCLFALATLSKTTLSSKDGSRHPCLYSDTNGNVASVSNFSA